MHRIVLLWPEPETAALLRMARDDGRPAKEQLLHIVREAARARGITLVPSDPPPPAAPALPRRAA